MENLHESFQMDFIYGNTRLSTKGNFVHLGVGTSDQRLTAQCVISEEHMAEVYVLSKGNKAKLEALAQLVLEVEKIIVAAPRLIVTSLDLILSDVNTGKVLHIEPDTFSDFFGHTSSLKFSIVEIFAFGLGKLTFSKLMERNKILIKPKEEQPNLNNKFFTYMNLVDYLQVKYDKSKDGIDLNLSLYPAEINQVGVESNT